jgi:hypothetical protein
MIFEDGYVQRSHLDIEGGKSGIRAFDDSEQDAV